jgi:predicted dithiol-disulfide oxidoreductase (DUF899 family)
MSDASIQPAPAPTRGQQQLAALNTALAEKEKQLEALHAEMNALRRELAQMPVEDYALTARDGSTVRLGEAFGAHDRMLLIHNMGFACSYCTLWAEEFSGIWDHLENGKYAPAVKFLLVSNDRPDQQQVGSQQRDWGFDMLSARGTTLPLDLGFAEPAQEEGKLSLWPGVSALVKDPDGSIRRVGMGVFGPGDSYCGFWHLLELFGPQPHE